MDDWAVAEQLAELGRVLSKRINALAGRRGVRRHRRPASQWPQLTLEGAARAWEPKRLRLWLFAAAGRLVRGGRRLRLRLAATWPWAGQFTAAISRLQAYASG